MSIIADIEEDEDDYYESTLHNMVKSHSVHLGIIAVVESLQSKINQLDKATVSGDKTILAKAVGIKAKKEKKARIRSKNITG